MSWHKLRKSSVLKAALLGSAILLPAASPASATSLDEAIKQALSANPDIGVVASNREAVDEELRQARGLYLPQVDADASIGPAWRNDNASRNNSGSDTETTTAQTARLTVQQRLFDGFEADSTVQREKSRVQSAARRVYENSEVLGLDTIGAYLEVIRTRELVSLAERNLDIHLNILQSIEARLEGGGGSRADVAQTQTRVARARNSGTERYNLLRDAEAAYTRIVGSFPDDLSWPEFPSDSLPQDLESALSVAEQNNLTTKIAEADVDTARAEVGVAEVPLWPSLSLEGSTAYTDGQDSVDKYEWNSEVLLTLRWNLFRGGIDRASRQEALSRVNESKNRRYQSYLNSQQEMRQSWYALEAGRQSVLDLEKAVQFSVETRDAYREQFDVAQRTLLDVLDAENELFVTSSELVTAQTNEMLASYRVLAVGGVLLKNLQITPPKQAFVEETSWTDGLLLD